ncbi:hypothetical protein C900_00806 [Fulvivirga imtechensis AK7]|uniref:OmpA-like domain-containing protein n=1 Tax=Fulvivirga imtechensis AK7 TaxID=1237149 RepID=L8JVM2_9BACT|nr:OmpA family protein [Fulvivirga imtechensis]ELR72845.1 hypothetical protein C900_00806 [Fulvivirga imtechensis AK7]
MKRIVLIFLSSIFGFFPVLAQVSDMMKEAELSYNKGDLYAAIPLYQQVVKHDPKNIKAWHHLGNAVYHVRDHYQAVDAYEKLLKLLEKEKGQRNSHYKAFFNLGNSLMAIGKYDAARKVFLDFLRLKPLHADYRELKRMANANIKSCQLAKEMIAASYPNEYSTVRMPNQINSAYSDFGPVWIDPHTLLYTSMQSDTLLKSDGSELHPHLSRLYIARQENTQWQAPEQFEHFNHELYHAANGSFSADGKEFIYSVCQESPSHEIRCALYMAKKNGDRWSEPEKLKNGINHVSSTSTQPSLGEIKRKGYVTEVLYFVSNRHGGRGGMDIWYSVKNNKGEWDTPINCGSAINTSGNEVTPYFHSETSELYFSSDYHFGLGGYDVFKAYGGMKSWKNPVNMGIGVNSGFDDTYFSWRIPEIDGSLVSNRDGAVSVFGSNCCDDIFMVEKQPVYERPGIVVLADSIHVRLSHVNIGHVLSSEGEDTDSIRWVTMSDADGHFTIKFKLDEQLKLAGVREGLETSYKDVVNDSGNQADTIVIAMERSMKWREKLDKIGHQELEVLSKESLAMEVKKGTVLVLEHIYFDFNRAEVKPEAHQDLNLLESYLRRHPTTHIEIAGHTDSKGDAQHNHDLSQRRAEAIRQHLINKGINAKRLVAVGYGEDRPIAPNENPDGSDNPEGRRLNRRTEVVFLEE